MSNQCQPRRCRRLLLVVSASASFLLTTGTLPILPGIAPAAIAQRVRPDGVWKLVYERLPDLPLENQYVSREGGQVATENTLIGRLIRYHLYVKGRPPFYRLDWKITLAEYLGINGTLDETTYPSGETLRKNPMEGDVTAIQRLNLAQRNALVQTLVDAFTQPSPNSPNSPATPPATTTPPIAPSPKSLRPVSF